jgi:hypothetical protein
MAFYKKSNVIIIVKGEKMKLSKKEFLAILKEKRACTEAVKWVKESKRLDVVDFGSNDKRKRMAI